MGKKKQKQKALKLPKRIAGVKVPKALRSAGTVDALLNTQMGRTILADALVAAAGAAAAALVRNRPSAEQVAGAGEAATEAGASAATAAKDLGGAAVGAVAGAVTEAARQILPASLTGIESRKAEPYPPRPDDETESRKGKARERASKH